MCTTAGVVTNMSAVVGAAPGSGKSWTLTLQKNDSDTAMVAVISDTAKTATYTATQISVSAGDTLNWKIVPSGTPTALQYLAISTEYVTTGPHCNIFCQARNNISSNVYYPIACGAYPTATADGQSTLVMPVAGTLTKMSVKLVTATDADTGILFTVYKNGSPTSLSFSVSDGEDSMSDSGNVPVVPGDRISVYCEQISTPPETGVALGLEFLPAVFGIFPMATAVYQSAPFTGNATEYIAGLQFMPTVPDESYFGPISRFTKVTLLGMSLYSTAAPGAGEGNTFTLISDFDGFNDLPTTIIVTLSDTAQSGRVSAAHTFSTVEGAAMRCVPNDTSAASIVSFGYPAIIEQYPQNMFWSD
jgi:hypothetical protein